MTNRTVSVTLLGNVTQYLAALRTAGAATAQFGASGTKLAAQTGLVSAKMAGLATGIGYVAYNGIKQMADFERAMSLIQATTEATTEQMKQLRQAALDVGGDSIYTPTEAADGIAILSKAGVDASDIIGGALAGALSLAAAGEMEVGEAAEIAAGALNTFRIAGEDMPHVADLLAAAANEAQGEVHDLGFALRMSSAVAAQAGMNIEETIAGLGAMANRGLLGSDAGTSLKSFMVHLTATTDTAAASMKKLGLEAYNAQGDFIGLEGVAQQLQEGLAKMNQEEQLVALRTVFGTDAIRAAAVFGEEGAFGIQDWLQKTDRDGYAKEFMDTLNDNLIGDMKKLRSAMNELFIESAQGTNGPLRELTQGFTDVAGAVTKMNNALQEVPDAEGKPWGGGLFEFGPTWLGRQVNFLEDNPLTGPQGLGWTRGNAPGSTRWSEDPGVDWAALGAAEAAKNNELMAEGAAIAQDLLAAVDNLAVANTNATSTTYGLADAADAAVAAANDLASSTGAAAGGVASLDDQMQAAIDGAMGYIDTMQRAEGASRDLLGMGDALRASALQPAAPRAAGSSSGSDSKARAAATKANNERIARIRKRDLEQQNKEIEAARDAADRKAERRADRQARKDVTKGVKEFIDTDKKAKRGENIDGFNNTGSVGERVGSLTEKESKALDAKIDSIRARHKKALDTQVKALRDAQKAALGTAGATNSAASATREYNTSLDKNTAAGRKNLDTLDAQIDLVQENALAAGEAAKATGADAAEVGDAVREALLKGRDALVAQAVAEGYAADEVQKYLDKFDLIKPIITTLFKVKVEVDDTELDSFERRLARIMKEDPQPADRPSGKDNRSRPAPTTAPKPTVRTPVTYGPPKGKIMPAFAMGGEFRGPGSTTSDSINARLSDREYVIRASQYAANRDLVQAINNGSGRVPMGGSVGVLIEGGVNVTAPNPIAAGQNVIDELDQQAYRKAVR